MDYENYLAHYGVKGMKWGVRRGAKSRITSVRKKVSKSSKEFAKTSASVKKSLKTSVDRAKNSSTARAGQKVLSRVKTTRESYRNFAEKKPFLDASIKTALVFSAALASENKVKTYMGRRLVKTMTGSYPTTR